MASSTGTSRKRSTPAKKTTRNTTRNTKPAQKRKSSSKNSSDNFITQEMVILLVVALSIILLLSNFNLAGSFGKVVSSVMFGIFGYLAYVFPFLLFLGAMFFISNKSNSVARIKLIAAMFTAWFLCGLVQLIEGNKALLYSYGDYYTFSADNHSGGGFLGGVLCKILVPFFGTIGAYVIILVLIIIGLVVVTEHSFINGLKRGSTKVITSARNDFDEYKETTARKRQEREELQKMRLENKVRGVALDTEIPKDENADIDTADIHELTPKTRKQRKAERAENARKDKYSEDIFPIDSNAQPIEKPDFFQATVPFSQTEPAAAEEPDPFMPGPMEDTEPAIPEEPVPVTPEEDAPIWNYNDAQPNELDSPSDDTVDNIGIDTDLVASEFEKAQSGRVTTATTEPAPVHSDDMAPAHKSVVTHREPKKNKYVFPPVSLLSKGNKTASGKNDKELHDTAMKLQQTLANFGVKVTVTNVSCGPAVTRYEIQPEMGVKVSKIVSLADDIKLNLAAADIRIEAPIPGKAAVGIEVPNKENSGVMLGDLIDSPDFKKNKSAIAFAAGKDIAGQTVIADIAKMPHLLIAGATGSGKSVCINTIIMSILYRATPEEVRLIMIDPKVVELSVYNGIPHLFIPVVTDPKKAAAALNWAVAEMTDRYNKFAQYGVRDIKGYNDKVEHLDLPEDQEKPAKMPQFVIIVDELADLMMVSSNEVEDAIVRLAQLARAAGIHLVIATQRPSVNVITGLIKANVPSRIAFSVSSGVDSRTIIDMNGAEKLLGKGDMLFYPSGYQKPARVQGAFVSDEEVSKVVEFLSQNSEPVEYNEDAGNVINNPQFAESQAFGGDRDQYFEEAGRYIIEKERASIGLIQRVYKVGFNRAARIMDQLCEAGVVGPEEGTKPRKIMMTMEEFDNLLRG